MKNKIKLMLLAASALLIIGGAFFAKKTYREYEAVKDELSAYRSNQRAYEMVVSGQLSENRVLSMSNMDLKQSNDKLIHSIDSIRKSFKEAKNKPGDVSVGVNTDITVGDTTYISNPSEFGLDTVINYNEFTSNSIKINKDTLISSINVNNSMFLYVYSKRGFVNEYDGWFNRLLHLDYKKESYNSYNIKNTNDLINVGDVRIIKVRE